MGEDEVEVEAKPKYTLGISTTPTDGGACPNIRAINVSSRNGTLGIRNLGASVPWVANLVRHGTFPYSVGRARIGRRQMASLFMRQDQIGMEVHKSHLKMLLMVSLTAANIGNNAAHDLSMSEALLGQKPHEYGEYAVLCSVINGQAAGNSDCCRTHQEPWCYDWISWPLLL